MRICMLTSFFLPTIGGVENHVYNLCKALQKRGHEVVVVHTCFDIMPKENKTVKVENVEGIEVHRLYLGTDATKIQLKHFPIIESYVNGFLRKVRPIRFSSKIAAYIQKLHMEKPFDILHQHDFISNLFTTKKLSRQLPVILTNHTGEFLLLNKHWYTAWTLRYLLSHIAYLLGPSEELCDVPFLQRKRRVSYIPNGVNLNEFEVLSSEAKVALRKEMGYEQNAKLILCARRWAPTKGVIYLVEAIPHVISKWPQAHFLISGNDYYGYPAYRDMIWKIIREQHLEPYITLLGDIPHDHINKYYQVADIVVLPSLMEATSLSGLEAMACGSPLLGTDVGGIPEIIEDGYNGRLVPAKSAKAIAKTLIEMLKNEELLLEQGKNGRRRAEQEFSWDVVAAKNEEVYMQVKNL